jgi:hypothetical protein
VTGARLKIKALIDRARARNWQLNAVDMLRRAGHDVRLAFNPEPCSLPAAIALLLTLERLIYGASETSPGAMWNVGGEAEQFDGEPDLTLDFTCFVRPAATSRTLRFLYAGSVMEEAGYMDLLNNRAPLLAICDSKAMVAPRAFRIAIEDPFRISTAMDIVGARFASFLFDAIEDIAQGGVISGSAGVPSETLRPDFLGWSNRQAISALADRARGLINRLTTKAPHWYVGWRRTHGEGVKQTLSIPPGGWNKLADDGKRFYADPFAVHRDGRDWLFVEEFPYATRKGIISAVEIGAGGPLGLPKPVLDLSHHLSYPFVFERDGVTWMIPESSATKRVELFRCVQFPDKWELAAVLLEGEEVSDATLVEHQGRLWMFGTASSGWQSSWDTLRIWTSETLFGPWHPAGSKPALIDSMGARPAGAFFQRNGELWRPAQDCTTGYGRGLVLARVDRLDLDGFSQTISATLRPNQAWPGLGIHTVNTSHSLEVVDGCRG